METCKKIPWRFSVLLPQKFQFLDKQRKSSFPFIYLRFPNSLPNNGSWAKLWESIILSVFIFIYIFPLLYLQMLRDHYWQKPKLDCLTSRMLKNGIVMRLNNFDSSPSCISSQVPTSIGKPLWSSEQTRYPV